MPNFIQPSEYDDRRKRVIQAMNRLNIACLVLLPGANFYYLTGLKFARERFRLLVALLFDHGELILMGPRFEEEKMVGGAGRVEVLGWADEEDQYQRVASVIEQQCGDWAKIGLELTANVYHYRGLCARLPKAEIVDPHEATEGVRAIKSTAEIACLKKAAQLTEERMARVGAQLAPGMTELELARRFGKGAMVQFGENTAMPNAVAGAKGLKENDIVVIDAGDWVEGYRSDLTRVFFNGTPTPKMKDVWKIVDEARSAAIEAARPGEPAERVDLAARQIIEKAGYGAYFTHRGGHGLGLEFHEIPICVRGNKDPLQPGMVLTAEPGIYLPGEFGIRLEDDILVAPDRPQLLSNGSRMIA